MTEHLYFRSSIFLFLSLLLGIFNSALLPGRKILHEVPSIFTNEQMKNRNPLSQANGGQVTIDTTKVFGTSSFLTGVTHIDHSLTYGDPTAIANAKSLLANALVFQNISIMGWGPLDPWPNPAASEPDNWGSLDKSMANLREMGATPILSFMNAPWWMKGQLKADGSTLLIPDVNGEWNSYTYSNGITDFRNVTYPAGYVSPHPNASRILDSQMDRWIFLVQRAAERYMAPPYSVRYFVVWNEMKGYYNPALNKWDYENQPGDTTGYNAKHGYTYMYNRIYQKLREVAAGLGIDPNAVRIGGPYAVINTWTSPPPDVYVGEPLLQNKPYGTYDQRDLDVVKYWLQNKTGAAFIGLDVKNRNREVTALTDPYTANNKFLDVINWVRSLDDAAFPGAKTLPILYIEWHSNAYDTTDRLYNNSVKADGVMKVIKAGGRGTVAWGSVEYLADWKINPSLITNTNTASGGQPLPWYSSYKAFRDYFSPGTQLLATTQTTDLITVLACPLKTILVNKTNANLTVLVNGVSVTLSAFQVLVMNTPPSTPSAPTPTLTAVPTATRTPTPVLDTSPPTVSITNPRNNAIVTRSSTVNITASASDNIKVDRVEFSVTGKGGNFTCTDRTSPYACSWPVPSKPNTTYTITVTAYDTKGNASKSQITVTSSR